MKLSEQHIFLVDLLSLSPFYDRYLFEAIAAHLPKLRLYAATFPYETEYWRSVPVNRAALLFDCVARLNLDNKRIRRTLQVFEYACNWVRLMTDARRDKVAVVHIEWLPLIEVSDLELWAVRQLSRSGAAVVYTAHNALPHEGSEHLKARYIRVCRAMDRVLVHTEGERRRLVHELGISADSIDVVPHGPMLYDLAPVSRSRAREQLGFADADEVVLFVGLIRPYKGIEELLSATAKLRAYRPLVKLLIAGQGETAYIRTVHSLIEKLNLFDQVAFLDRYIPVAEMPKLYASADVTVLPYRSASQSGALFTLASFNVPLVATAVGGIGEVLAGRDMARLVPTEDPASLATAIADLLERPETERRALAGRLSQWAREQCSWERAADLTLEAYERAIMTRRRRQR
ncbi:MAG: glycosyltransferase [Deltaproteobacteria bacterium]|nr:glycosyltransferase [Deltaproteobacteria bacterium]